MAKTSSNWFSDSKIKQYQKFLAAVTALVGLLVSQGVLHGTAESVTNAVIVAIGAILVALLPNANPLSAARNFDSSVGSRKIL